MSVSEGCTKVKKEFNFKNKIHSHYQFNLAFKTVFFSILTGIIRPVYF